MIQVWIWIISLIYLKNKSLLTRLNLTLGGIICFQFGNRLVQSNMATTCVLKSTLFYQYIYIQSKFTLRLTYYVTDLYLWHALFLRSKCFFKLLVYYQYQQVEKSSNITGRRRCSNAIASLQSKNVWTLILCDTHTQYFQMHIWSFSHLVSISLQTWFNDE